MGGCRGWRDAFVLHAPSSDAAYRGRLRGGDLVQKPRWGSIATVSSGGGGGGGGFCSVLAVVVE